MNGRRTIALITLALTVGAICSVTALAQNADPVATTPPAPPPPLSPVIWSENPDVIQRFAVTDNQRVREMVDRCLLKLTSAPDIATAWTRLGITSSDVVGIKITTTGGQLLSTHRPIVQAICAGIEEVGVPPSHIVVWDKNEAIMVAAGYAPTPATDSTVAIDSVFPGTGYDPDVFYKNGIIGSLIWGDSEFVRHDDDLDEAAQEAVKKKGYTGDGSASDFTSIDDPLNGGSTIPQSSDRSHYARLVTSICTKIVNVPVLTDNSAIGIDGCLGTLAFGMIDNDRRFQNDPTFGDPAIGEILDKDFVRRKVVVHILDALISQYAGGPHFDPQFTKSIGAIYVGRDPVAIDSLVLKRLEAWRAADRNGRIDLIGKAASHIHSAAESNIGTDDPARIQLIRVP